MAKRNLIKFPHLFPHIPRIYSRIILILVFLFLASLLIEKGKAYGTVSEENIQGIYEKLKERPDSEILHYKLAKALQKNGNFEEAVREFLIAKELGVPANLVNDSLIQIQDSKVTHLKISTDLERWKKIVSEKPDYRDGWYQIALLEWRLSNNTEAKNALIKALELDPNYAPARDFFAYLSS